MVVYVILGVRTLPMVREIWSARCHMLKDERQGNLV